VCACLEHAASELAANLLHINASFIMRPPVTGINLLVSSPVEIVLWVRKL